MGVPVNVVTHIKAGRLRAVAIAGNQRLKALPNVPSFAEEGLPGVSLPNWQGIGGPIGLPRPIIDKIAAEIEKLVAIPDTVQKLEAEGFVPYYRNPEQLSQLINANIDKVGKIVKAGNIKSDQL
jgi:tripartite-type tricarboxylate transporter receptor subunit TctC